MRVYLDTTPLQDANRVRGVGKYTQNLLDAIKTRQEIELVDGVDNADIVHYPFFDLFFHTLSSRRPKPTIVTIHDVIPLVLESHFPIGIKGAINFYLQKRALGSVHAVITSSNCAKEDIPDYLPVKPKNIFVAYQSVSSAFKPLDKASIAHVKAKFQLPENFLLYVGDINYNKNIIGLIKAFAKVQNKQCNLLLVGKAFMDPDLPEAQAISQAIDDNHVVDRVHKSGFVSDEELPALYNLAIAYIQPSLYEGFGRPILEAMACGTPVLSSNTSSLPEVYGNAALSFDPTSAESMAQTIDKLISDHKLRTDLVAKGFEQAKKFSLDQFANSVAHVYQTVYNQSH